MQGLNVPQTIARVPEGHYVQWVNACIAGYGKNELSSPFEYAGPLTETILMGNLALRSYISRTPTANSRPQEAALGCPQYEDHQFRRGQPVCESEHTARAGPGSL
jgi:hypothetical protein